MKSCRPFSILAVSIIATVCLLLRPLVSAATISIQADEPGAMVSSNLFGIFFEEINFAGDGGLYAELVRNRSFASSGSPDFWTFSSDGTANGQMTVDTTLPLNTNNLRSLKLSMNSGVGRVRAANSGYWGIALQSSATYHMSFYARVPNGTTGAVNVRLENAAGNVVYAETAFGNITPSWQKFTAALVASGTDDSARLVLSVSNIGSVCLDEVSLVPAATYADRTNGLRLDLANMLADLSPSFYRYPGGNFIESWDITNAVRWKKTIGDLVTRPGHLNDAWGYWSTDGYGLDEFFRQCEDLGMEPIYGINAGLMLGYNGSANNTVPMAEMGPWVQDALDLIEYANGDTNTTWGALRAANGHPAPYGLKLLEIGNENGGSLYNERYTLFHDAIKAQYPEIRLIAPGNWSGGPPWSRPLEIIDEHYYTSPATFRSFATKYDTYNRAGPKVFVGEYAVTSGYGTYGNLAAALGEAAFMTGIERNSDIVEMACYAPLFANINDIQWHPDLIYYDNQDCFGTPAYYVQKLFSQNRGDFLLPTVVDAPATVTNPLPHGAIGLGSWSTSVQYSNVVVTSNGVTLYQSDFLNSGTNGWRVFLGDWSTLGGIYQQTSTLADCRSTTGDTNWANYTISLRARKLGGSEGFLILFNWTDDNNWTWLNLGGWNNSQHSVEQNLNGSKSDLGPRVSGSIAANVWYDITVVLSNRQVRCYLDGDLVLDVNYAATSPAGLYVSTTFDHETGEIILKAVNPNNVAMDTAIECTGLESINSDGTLLRLTSGSSADENSLANPTKVFPVMSPLFGVSTNFSLTLPANSLSVIRLVPDSIHTYTNLQIQVPSPINTGQAVPATVLGQKRGTWVDLTANSNYAISFRSLDSDVAVVDGFGNVAGQSPGTAKIVADYGALGLSATQNVSVAYVPTTLVHRYSFNESSGTNVADSVGGPTWNGTLPRGGSFGDGLLGLAASSQQYVNLPSQILSNYAAVTIESWVTFPNQLPVNCFYFGFGDKSGNSGDSYLFCAPRAGRIAIASGDWTTEQNARSETDFSFRTNLHLTAVFNPPAGYAALYTNGVLAGINADVTLPLSVVNNAFSYVGRSLYANDPYPDFSLDEFRIYDGALSANEIAATEALGPQQLLDTSSPQLSASRSGNELILSWPLVTAGWNLAGNTNLVTGIWTKLSVSAEIVGNTWRVTVPATADQFYYRLQR